MKKIFITATNTNIGKTFTTLKLIESLNQRGIKTIGYKPIETGVDIDNIKNSDTYNIYQASKKFCKELELEDVYTYHFSIPASPYVAKTEAINISLILQKIEQLEKKCDLLLIEGAGGLYVPISKDFFMIDLICLIKANALLVTKNQLGCINDTLLSIKALEERSIKYLWCVNMYLSDGSFDTISKPFYLDYFGMCIMIDDEVEELTNNILELIW